MRPSISIITLLAALTTTSAFQTPSSPLHLTRVSQTVLTAEAKKRRRRKQVVDSDATTTPPPAPSPPKESAQSLAAQMLAQEKMMYDQEDDLTTFTPVPLSTSAINAAATKAGFDLDPPKEELNDLFDAGEFLSKKRERQLAELENAEGNPAVPTKKKIKRSDIQAYTKLLEMDPLADEDSRYFEDENEVDIISALLGDVEPGVGVETDEENRTGKKVVKKTSFLGIGSGPLQVGHFIGALGVVLMAFVEYPGFPLTNLPDPLRGALQGGLGTIYLINTVLAVFAAMSAPSRKQPPLLWAAKTFAVGGIAYDQLMQIPTPEELVEKARREEEALSARGRRRGKRQS